MEADDELCLCFHISCRKVLNYLRVHQVKVPSQLAECGGAGTGCGWCRKQLEKLMILASEDPPASDRIEDWLKSNTPDRERYAQARARYKKAKEASKSTDADSDISGSL